MALKQLEAHIENIDGMTFAIRPFPAFKAANLTGELASTLAPIFAALMPLLGDTDVSGIGSGPNAMENAQAAAAKSLEDIDVRKAASAIQNIAGLDGDRIENLMKKLLLGGHITVSYSDDEGQRIQEILDADTANEIFCGSIDAMFILCFDVIKVNFSGFFEKLARQSGTPTSETSSTEAQTPEKRTKRTRV